jgi:hypothetical protein
MANKVTQQDILQFNILYKKLGTYAAVSRETGFSASTVKRYIIPDFINPEEIEIQKFDKEIKDIEDIEIVWDLRLAADERKEIEELWKEISL